MDSIPDFAKDPRAKRQLEKLLHLAARRGDADLVAERLGWGIDPNCVVGKKGRTPLITNVCRSSPNAATVRALLKFGADPAATDVAGLTALDYARRKLLRIQNQRRRPPEKSPSLDENNQLILDPEEQAELDEMRAEFPDDAKEIAEMYWRERLRAARRTFNDPEQIELIVEILEAAGGK
jgi:hypothetical protein